MQILCAALERLVLANARQQRDLAHQPVFALSVADHVADQKNSRLLRTVVEQETAAVLGRDRLLERRDDLSAEPRSYRRRDSVQALDDRAVIVGLAPRNRAVLGPDHLDQVVNHRGVEGILGLERGNRQHRHARWPPVGRGVGSRERQIAIGLAAERRVKPRFKRAPDVCDHCGRRAQTLV
jgi:hypothetical protein